MSLLTYVDVAIESRPDHIILVTRDSKSWTLPGCRLNPGEAPRDGAIRSAQLETGLTISLHERLSKYIFINSEQSSIGTSTLFAARGYGILNSITPNLKTREFSLERLPMMTAEHAEMVADYIRWSVHGVRPELQRRLSSTKDFSSLTKRAA